MIIYIWKIINKKIETFMEDQEKLEEMLNSTLELKKKVDEISKKIKILEMKKNIHVCN